MNLPYPKSEIENYAQKFLQDKETARAENTVQEVIAAFPKNEKIEHVVIKIVAINSLYHARVLDVDLHPLALHIHGIENLDGKLAEGNLEVVDEIWTAKGRDSVTSRLPRSSATGTTKKAMQSTTHTCGKRYAATGNNRSRVSPSRTRSARTMPVSTPS